MAQMRAILFSLVLLLCTAGTFASPGAMVAELRLDASTCQVKTPLNLQLVILDLNNRHVVFSEDTPLTLPQPGQKSWIIHRRARLEPGSYLAEFLIYDEIGGGFRLVAAAGRITHHQDEWKVSLAIPDLPQKDFQKFARRLVYRADRPSRYLRAHMLWCRINYDSLRPEEARAGLYARLRLDSLKGNPEAFSGTFRDRRSWEQAEEAGDYLPEIIADQTFEGAVRADNCRLLASPVPAENREALRKRLKELANQAKKVAGVFGAIGLPNKKLPGSLKEAHRESWNRMPLSGLQAELQERSERLFAAVCDELVANQNTVNRLHMAETSRQARELEALARFLRERS